MPNSKNLPSVMTLPWSKVTVISVHILCDCIDTMLHQLVHTVKITVNNTMFERPNLSITLKFL